MSKAFQEAENEKAYVLIKCEQGSEKYVLDHLGCISGVEYVECTVGTGCLLIGINAYTVEGLHETIVSKIQPISLIYSTMTLICSYNSMKEWVS